jgi:hypothetical protein
MMMMTLVKSDGDLLLSIALIQVCFDEIDEALDEDRVTTSNISVAAASRIQKAYAKLLSHTGYYGLYEPRRDIEIGDVASFHGFKYTRHFNVFDLSAQVRFLFPNSLSCYRSLRFVHRRLP